MDLVVEVVWVVVVGVVMVAIKKYLLLIINGNMEIKLSSLGSGRLGRRLSSVGCIIQTGAIIIVTTIINIINDLYLFIRNLGR